MRYRPPMIDRNALNDPLSRARRKLAESGADVLFVTPSTNLFYLAGLSFHRSERLTAVLLPRDGEPVLITPAFEETHARSMTAIDRVVTWQETEDPFRKAASFLGAAKGVLCVEPSTAYDDVEKLLAHAPGWTPRSGADVFAAMRMVKSAAELDAMRRAVATGLDRFRKAFSALAPGVREADVSAAFGGENVVQFGPSAAVPHGEASARTLSKNEAVLIDAWDNPEGYYYDITRSTFYGTPTDEYRRVWDV